MLADVVSKYKIRRNRKGFFFTIATILLILPLILLIMFYSNISDTSNKDAIARIRCDELHYFVEDIEEDLNRAMVIFGRRSAVYAVDYVVSSGISLRDYSFYCSPLCPMDCNTFIYNNTGSEAAIGELILCGTLYGENVTYMINHTMREWIDRILIRSQELHYNVNITVDSIDVVPMDAWHFYVRVNNKISISDDAGLCHYSASIMETSTNTSILDLEDPLYTLYTDGHIFKQIINCEQDLSLSAIAGCSKTDTGYGNFSGTVILYSQFTGLTDLENYCNETPQEILGQQVLVVDQGWGTVCNKKIVDCFNASQPKHFGALVLYEDTGKFNISSCMPTIPWISDTGEMDNETPWEGGSRDPNCDDAFITNGSCILIVNEPSCGVHTVFIGYDPTTINTTCYFVSNISRYDTNCTENYSDGPSFFDRLEGNLNLSEKYVEQAMEYFNTSDIGIETIVNLVELDTYSRVYPNIKFYPNATWIDYLYWQNVSGCRSFGSCEVYGYKFNLDCQHSYELGIDTACTSINYSYCPTEICINCIDDDYDGQVDWNDSDCSSFFSDGCGEVHYCDPTDSDTCNTCDTPMPPEIPDNSSNYCNHYGYNTTEWHFYRIVPDITGNLTIEFNGTGIMTGNYRTDLGLYSYNDSTCTSPTIIYQLEPGYSATFCVTANNTYIIALDIDSDNCTYNGYYYLNTTIVADSSC